MRELIPDAAQRGQAGTISGASTRRSLRWLAYAGLGGVGSLVVAVLLLHWLQPDLAPLDEAMSYYVHGAQGWLLTAGLLGLGLGSVALTAGLATAAAGPGSRVGRWFLALWSVGVLLAGIFPADPPGNWDKPLSRAGMIHGNAALVAFVALPVAALCLARSFRRDPQWRPCAGVLLALALAAAVSLLAFMASLAPVFVSPRTANTARAHAADSPRGLRRLARRCRDRTPAGVASESRRTR